MLSDGVRIRAEIDTESVRNVMLVNGGGSVALIALLPTILGTPLVLAALLTLAIWLFGLTLAVTHSVLRRKCSHIHEKHDMNPPPGKPKFGIEPKEPWVCWWSWNAMYASILAFFIGGAVMVSMGLANLEDLSNPPDPQVEKAGIDCEPHNSSLKADAVNGAA